MTNYLILKLEGLIPLISKIAIGQYPQPLPSTSHSYDIPKNISISLYYLLCGLRGECFLRRFHTKLLYAFFVSTIGVRFPAGAGNFSLNYRVQNGSEAHPASYLMGTGGSFPGGKAAGA